MSGDRATDLEWFNPYQHFKQWIVTGQKKSPAYSIHILLLKQEKALESLIASLASGFGLWAQNCLMNEICTCMNFISHISY